MPPCRLSFYSKTKLSSPNRRFRRFRKEHNPRRIKPKSLESVSDSLGFQMDSSRSNVGKSPSAVALLPSANKAAIQAWLNGCSVAQLTGFAAALTTFEPRDFELEQWLYTELENGRDPLGAAFSVAHPPVKRRARGQTFTPSSLVTHMLDWADQPGAHYSRIVDPGAGTGRYILSALKRFPSSHGVAVESDPQVAELLKTNSRLLGLAERLTVLIDDYRAVQLEPVQGSTLFIGNPPYVRHHDIEEKWKLWYSETLKKEGVKGNKLAGLHLHFFAQTLKLARPGDVGCFVTSAEWLDTGYGAALRALMLRALGGERIEVCLPQSQTFEDAMVSAAVACFRLRTSCESIDFRAYDSFQQGRRLLSSRIATPGVLEQERKWSLLLRGAAQVEHDTQLVELGELFRVQRGQVTGCNRVWVAGEHARELPERFLTLCVTDAKDISRAPGQELCDCTALKQVVDLPSDLTQLENDEREAVERFLEWAKAEGAHQSYIAQHRRPWWRVSLRPPAPIVMTYMGRKPPSFALNSVGASLINVAHGLYPRVEFSRTYLRMLVEWLNKNVPLEAGRVYAGGLTKFEPSEVMRLRIPPPEYF